MAEISNLIKQINKKGWLVSTAWQDGYVWNVGLRPSNDFTCAYGSAKTLEGALKKAMKNIHNRMTEQKWKKFKKEQEKSKPKKLKRVRL